MACRLTLAFLALVLSAGCGTARVVLLDTGQGAPLMHRPPPVDKSSGLGAEEFERALEQLVLVTPLSLRAPGQGWLVRAAYSNDDANVRWRRLMSKSFGGICEAGQRKQNCLSLLDDVLELSEWDKLGVALGLSLDPMRESISRAVEKTLAPQIFYTVIATGLISWAALAANPEPVFTKAAAVVSALLLIYLGVEVFLELVDASQELKRTTDNATMPRELEQAGQRFANRVGPEVARVVVLAVTVGLSYGMAGGAALLASRLPLLPNLPEAAALGASRVGLNLAHVGQVSAVAISAGGTITMTLPASAVAALAQEMGGAASGSVVLEWAEHHIATDKWSEATHSGGPWTPKFQELFERAGMSLNDPANIVRVRGHKGPHPQEYHAEVYRRLREALQGCRGVSQCKESLKAALNELREEIAMEGTPLNRLITRTE